MSALDEYLPERRQKAFTLAPPPEDWAPYNARDEVVLNDALDPGARLMFVRLLDLATREANRARYGVVTISQTKLAEELGASVRTIWNWKRQLLDIGAIWMTSQPMPNAWPIDTYHITALDHPSRSQGKTSPEGMWGNGHRRFDRPASGMGARQPGQQQIPGTGVRSKICRPNGANGKTSKTPANAAQSGNTLPVSVATHCDGEPQPVAAGSGNPLRAAPAAGCDGEPKPVAGGTRNPLRAAPAAGCEHKKSVVEVVSDQSRGTPPNSDDEQAFKEWEDRQFGRNGHPKKYDRELRETKHDLYRERKLCADAESLALVDRKIDAVEVALHGPQPKKTAPAKPAVTPKPAAEDPELVKKLTADLRAAVESAPQVVVTRAVKMARVPARTKNLPVTAK